MRTPASGLPAWVLTASTNGHALQVVACDIGRSSALMLQHAKRGLAGTIELPHTPTSDSALLSERRPLPTMAPALALLKSWQPHSACAITAQRRLRQMKWMNTSSETRDQVLRLKPG